MNRKMKGIFLIVLGLVLAFIGAGIYASYESRANAAKNNAEILLQDVQRDLERRKMAAVITEAPEGQMPQTSVDGHAVIGILQVEEAGIRLPVLGSWSYELLEHGPCRYSGSLQTEDLVLLGHNYKGHLADLDQAELGDLIDFTDAEGTVHSFKIAETAIIQPTDVQALSAGSYPLTIFTCTPGGQSRYVVYCEK
ncbi:MAG: sortase [Oscillospiraceae bacterium]|nr:sortase [Oscillospiraceae bacterium]